MNSRLALADALARRGPDDWIVAPGLVDLQVNGFAGAEVGDDPDQIADVARALPAAGVTAWCPTLVTRSDAGYVRAARALGATPWPEAGARPLGVHLEGPFLNPARAGAHPAGRMRDPAATAVERLATLFSPRIVTLAPERAGAVDAIAWLVRRGVTVACGHTEATAAETRTALDAGARLLTHALNAMPGMSARDPGPVGTFLAHPGARVGLIADGVHVAPEMCATLARAAGARLVLVSDATAATNAPAGRYRLAGRTIVSDGTRATVGGRLAGGTAPLWRCVATLVACGVSPRRTLAAAATTPRRLLGIPPAAFPDDLVLLDAHFVPRLTLVGGLVAFIDPGLPFDAPEVGRPFRV